MPGIRTGQGGYSFAKPEEGYGAVRAIENLLLNTFGLDPWGILILMLLSFVLVTLVHKPERADTAR